MPLLIQINEVDKGLLKFTNLEELSLTGNSLTAINGSHLPRSLKVIEIVIVSGNIIRFLILLIFQKRLNRLILWEIKNISLRLHSIKDTLITVTTQ